MEKEKKRKGEKENQEQEKKHYFKMYGKYKHIVCLCKNTWLQGRRANVRLKMEIRTTQQNKITSMNPHGRNKH